LYESEGEMSAEKKTFCKKTWSIDMKYDAHKTVLLLGYPGLEAGPLNRSDVKSTVLSKLMKNFNSH